jgi:hypothetical protein
MLRQTKIRKTRAEKAYYFVTFKSRVFHFQKQLTIFSKFSSNLIMNYQTQKILYQNFNAFY